jgi:hypothetical protein
VSDDPQTDEPDDQFDYESRVGYGQPPKHTRWKKGQQSPNPRGRPRKNTSRKHFLEVVAHRPVALTIAGKTKQVTILEAVVERVKAKAISGNAQASRIYDMLTGVAGYLEDEHVELALFPIPERLTTEEWLESYERE